MKKEHIAGSIIAILILLGILYVMQSTMGPLGKKGTSATAIHLTWTNDDPSVTQVSIYRSDICLSMPNPSNLLATVAAPKTSFDDSNVVKGTVYRYTLFSLTSDGALSDPTCTSLSL